MSNQPSLFDPLQVGAMKLANRIVMAPMTRSRADDDDGTVADMHATYYAQRASAGLIISEAAQISPQGKGYINTPGIHSPEQVKSWQKVTKAVHDAGGLIALQLWHVGRISHVELQPGKQKPVAPSAIAAKAVTHLKDGFADPSEPRALETDEIAGIVKDYANAAKLAMEAGFDAVEVHSANGYLPEQFLKDGTNKRTDKYGGSIENRARFLFEVVEAVCREIGADRVGVRLSPYANFNDAADSDPNTLYSYVIESLNDHGLAYLHLIEGQTTVIEEGGRHGEYDDLRKLWRGVYMGNNGYDRDLAMSRVADGSVDLVAFGRPFIANPDLVERLRDNDPLQEADRETTYAGGEHGFTDYPALHKRDYPALHGLKSA